MKKAFKVIGWLCLICVVLIGGWFTVKILMPSLAATPATVPVWKVQVTPWAGDQHVAFTPDGKLLLDSFSNRRDHTQGIRRWDVASGKELSPIESDLTMLSKNGMFYATIVKQEKQLQAMRIYRVTDQKLIGEMPLSSKTESIVDIIGTQPIIITKHFKSTKTITGSATQRSYSFWDVSKKKFLRQTPRPTILYDSFTWSPDDIAFSDDGMKSFSIWPVFTLTSYKNKTSQFVEGLQPWPDSMIGKPKETWLLNEINGKVVKLPFSKKTPGIQFIWKNPTLSKDETLLAATSTNIKNGWSDNGEDGSVRCFDLPHRKLLWTYYKYKAFPDKLMFSPDGTMLANGGYYNSYRNNAGYLNTLNIKTGNVVHDYTEQTLWEQISDRTRKFLIDRADNTTFLKQHFDNSIEKYYLNPPLGNSGLPLSLAWSPDSKMLAAAYADGSLKLWRVKK